MSAKSKLEESFAGELRLYGLPAPHRQFIFHPTRRWRFDFAYPDRKIAIEVSGGLYVGGRHNRGFALELDYEKLNEAQRLGWKVFQFGPSQIRRKRRTNSSSKALAYMHMVLREFKPSGYEKLTQPGFFGTEANAGME